MVTIVYYVFIYNYLPYTLPKTSVAPEALGFLK